MKRRRTRSNPQWLRDAERKGAERIKEYRDVVTPREWKLELYSILRRSWKRAA